MCCFQYNRFIPKNSYWKLCLPCRLYEYYPLRISLDYTLYKIRWKRYPAEKSANQSALELQPWKTAQFWFFRIGNILFIYVIILNTDMNFENGGWFFIFWVLGLSCYNNIIYRPCIKALVYKRYKVDSFTDPKSQITMIF